MARTPDGFRPAWLRRLDARPYVLARKRLLEAMLNPTPYRIEGEVDFDALNVAAVSTGRELLDRTSPTLRHVVADLAERRSRKGA